MRINVPPEVELPPVAIGIRKVVAASGLSGEQFAVRVGSSPSTVRKWINGLAEPTEQKLARVANKCGVTQEWLRAGGTDAGDETTEGTQQ